MTVPEQLIQIVLISKNGSTPLTNVRAAAKAGRNLVVADGDVTDRTGLVAWPEPSWDRANSNIGRSCQATWATVCFRASNWALAVLPSRTETLRVGPSPTQLPTFVRAGRVVNFDGSRQPFSPIDLMRSPYLRA